MGNNLLRMIQGCEIKSVTGMSKPICAARAPNTEDFIEKINASRTIEEINDVCSQIRHHYGFDFFAIFVRINRVDNTPLCLFMREHENEWTNHYEAKQYMFSDPGIRVATTSISPFLWSSHLFDKVKSLLQAHELSLTYDAIDFGLRDVFNAPFIGQNGDYGLIRFVNLANGQSSLNDINVNKSNVPSLYYLSSYIYESLSRILRTNITAPPLSQRERDILLWSAQGKNPARIGLSLHISENTVRKHLSNIRRKLDVRNTTHAVAKAISSRMIQL